MRIIWDTGGGVFSSSNIKEAVTYENVLGASNIENTPHITCFSNNSTASITKHNLNRKISVTPISYTRFASFTKTNTNNIISDTQCGWCGFPYITYTISNFDIIKEQTGPYYATISARIYSYGNSIVTGLGTLIGSNLSEITVISGDGNRILYSQTDTLTPSYTTGTQYSNLVAPYSYTPNLFIKFNTVCTRCTIQRFDLRITNISNTTVHILPFKKAVKFENLKPNLHIDYYPGYGPYIDYNNCTNCLACVHDSASYCPVGAIKNNGNYVYIDYDLCVYCGTCSSYGVNACPVEAFHYT